MLVGHRILFIFYIFIFPPLAVVVVQAEINETDRLLTQFDAPQCLFLFSFSFFIFFFNINIEIIYQQAQKKLWLDPGMGH